MSRKRRRPNVTKPKAHIVEDYRDIDKETEFLSQNVDLAHLGDYGDDALIKALIYQLPEASEVEAMEIALALQKRLRGKASLLENPDMDDVVRDIKEQAVEIDKAAESFNRDSQSFVESVINSAPKMTDQQRARLQAKGHEHYKRAVTNTKASKHVKQLQAQQRLKDEPLVDLAVAGIPRIIGGKHRLIPERVQLMGLTFTLTPGMHKVPKSLAEAYYKRVQQRSIADQKKAIWSGQTSPTGGIMDFGDVYDQVKKLNEEYGITMEDIQPR
jgi:hypothetical protein